MRDRRNIPVFFPPGSPGSVELDGKGIDPLVSDTGVLDHLRVAPEGETPDL